MFPTINKKETGVNLRRIMDMRGVKPKDIQEYLVFGCVQSVYRWLDGVSMPTVDNLYAISKMLQVPMDSIVCGNAGRTKSQMDTKCENIRCKAVPYRIAARGWEKLQFHSYHPRSAAPGLSDGGG